MTGSRTATRLGAAPALEPTSGALRWVRGVVVGGAATGVAWAGHVTAGAPARAHPTGPVQLVLAAVAVVLGVALSRRRWTTPSLLVMLLGAQLAWHELFSLLPAGGHHGGPGLSGPAGAPAMAGMPGMPAMAPVGGPPGWLMPVMHVVAAVLTALLLQRGEGWCWWLLTLLVRPARRLLPAVSSPAWAGTTGLVLRTLSLRVLVPQPGSQPRRGPPVLVAA
jgi:hypothetical protein